jgi:hypothetical protein
MISPHAAPARRGAFPLLAALAAICAPGCGDDFSPYNRLDKLRVLAIRSEPVAPAPGETTALTALIYAPPGETVALSWSWCPFTGPAGQGSPCLVDEADLAVWSGGAPNLPPFELGAADSVSLPNTFDPALLRQLCTGAVAGTSLPEIADCTDGFPAQIKLVARSSDDEVVAVRPLRLRFESPTEPSFNPEIEGVTLLVGGQTSVVDDVGTAIIPREVETRVTIAAAESSAEPFTAADEAGQPIAVRERLFFTWFVEAGETKHERTLFIDGVTSFADARENRWTVPRIEDEPRDRLRIIVVARDSRGGVGWRTGTVALEGTP